MAEHERTAHWPLGANCDAVRAPSLLGWWISFPTDRSYPDGDLLWNDRHRLDFARHTRDRQELLRQLFLWRQVVLARSSPETARWHIRRQGNPVMSDELFRVTVLRDERDLESSPRTTGLKRANQAKSCKFRLVERSCWRCDNQLGDRSSRVRLREVVGVLVMSIWATIRPMSREHE